MIANEALDLIEEHTYLEQTVSGNPSHEKEITMRKGTELSVFGKYSLIMNSNLPLPLKRKVYKHYILLVLTYGLETCRLTKESERKLRSAQREMERKMLGVTWRDKKRASWIRKETMVKDTLIRIQNKTWTWSRLVRRICNRWTATVKEWQPRNDRRNQAGRE